MRLKELIQDAGVVKVEGPLDGEVAGVTYDSRRVTPGMVFVAIPGKNVDGHDFVDVAIDRGACAVICERNGGGSPKATKVRVSDARQALARTAAAFYQYPGSRLKTVGVTGTNGKTTVSFMVKEMLEGTGSKSGLIGTVRYEIGERIIPAQRTTPEALDIQQMLAQMVRSGCQACVMEVSSHALDQKRVDGIDFNVAVFTNLTQDHLDYHRDMETYYQAKKKLFSGTEKRRAVINIDDAYGARLHKETKLPDSLTYAVKNPAQLRADRIQLERSGTRFDLEISGKKLRCTLPLIGRHNVYNALAALGAGLALGLEPDRMAAALAKMPPVPGRLESIECGQPFGVFVDYAHTDDALRNVLATIREIARGRLLLAFGCGGNRDTGKRAKMGRVAAELADSTWITSDNPRREKPQEIAAQIERGYRDVRTDGYRIELDRRRAIDEVIRAAKPGDVVLIAGKGHETYQEFQDTVVPFDDRVYARETLESIGFGKGNV